MAHDKPALAETFHDYINAFQTLDPWACGEFCHVPCMFIGPQSVILMASRSEVGTFFTRVMEGLKARGYGRSDLTELQIKPMSDDTAFVSVGRVRYTKDGQEMERLGETYTFRKTEGMWKIVTAMVHRHDAVLSSS